MEKGTRVITRTENALWDGQTGVVTSSHTNGTAYVKLDSSPHQGSWAFGTHELEIVNA